MKFRPWAATVATMAMVLTACSGGSTPGTPTSVPSVSTTATQPSSSAPSISTTSPATSPAGRSAAAWQRLIDAAALAPTDLTSGFSSIKPVEPNGQTECPSLDAVATSRTHDLAYHRVSFQLSSTGTELDEVIAVSPDATAVVDDFATTVTACARFQSTASTGDVIDYQVSAQPVTKFGDQTAAVWVNGTTKNATGAYHVGEGLLVIRKGDVVIQIGSIGIPPPVRDLSPTVAALAYRKLLPLLSRH